MESVKEIIKRHTGLLENAKNLGLQAKAEEFNNILRFYRAAFKIISEGKVFFAERDFYKIDI